MKKLVLLSCLFGLPILHGCSFTGQKHLKCDDPNAIVLLQKNLQEQLEKKLDIGLKDLIKKNLLEDVDTSKLQVSAKSIQFNLMDSRTNHIDPDSPKTICAIDLTTTIPSDIIKKSDSVRNIANTSNTEDQAQKLELDFTQSKVKITLDYILQPSDKGDKIFATITNSDKLTTLLSDTRFYAFIKPQVDSGKIGFNGQQHEPDTQYSNEEYYE